MIRKMIGLAIFSIFLFGCDKDDRVSCEPGFAAVIDANGNYYCEPIVE